MTKIFLGEPQADIKQWIIDHYGPVPVVKPETHIKFVDGTEGDYLLEGNVDYQYLVEKGLLRYDGTTQPMWIKQPREVDIGSAVTNIGAEAFYECTSLMNVTIPDNVMIIDSDAFFNCYALTNMTIGRSVTSIGTSAFNQCHGLTSVIIPDSVTSIGEGAFASCINLTCVEFKGNAPTVETAAFENVASGCKAVISSTAAGFPEAGQTWNGLIVEITSNS